ncbi:hypothetical protein GRX03_03705 [Halovenus sp. WSH3]|uniref:Uncharacterized protein n=1 Tax=Halovenus carboxidivorans TaxID=2692199 RepID=A0A6B0T583_9EURY|nr:hypothetical protein [Halovenus carboxidivorans]MXR50713.1 hypothetical protein [Halovenus carboxidivorans]
MDSSRIAADERGMTSVVGKTLVIGIVLLYVGGMTTLLLGGVVPEYRSTAGAELGDRVLATAGGAIEQSVSEVNGTVRTNRSVDLPSTIRGRHYELELAGTRLRLRHPDPAIEGELSLALPPTMSTTNATWRSGTDLQIRVSGPRQNRTLTIDS